MFLEKIKTPGLAHLSWMVGDENIAVVVDPRRDIDVYISLAQKHNVNITCILETHRNEDLITGSKILSQVTGATIHHGECSDEAIEYAQTITDSAKFDFSKFYIEAHHTPGHTNDSMSFAVFDKVQGGPAVLVFTGDALFVGDVGRTDFYPGQEREFAGKLYESLQKILALGDQAILCPAHGAGSVCGDTMAEREFSTIGHERATNPGLQYKNKDAFVAAKISESHYKPPYFSLMEHLNSKGVELAPSSNSITLLNIEKLKKLKKTGAIIIDTRDSESFAAVHIPDSISLPISLLTTYVGWLVSPSDKIVIVTESMDKAKDTFLHLARVGFDNVVGAFVKPMAMWAASGEAFSSIELKTKNEVESRLNNDKNNWQLLDVRKETEVKKAKIEGSKHIYLGHLMDKIATLDKKVHYTVLCGSGVRATVGASLLKKAGVVSVDVFWGSMGAWLANK